MDLNGNTKKDLEGNTIGFIAPIAMAAASIFSAVSASKAAKKSSAPAPIAAPTAPTTADASAKAQAEVDKRRRVSLLSGGETNLTGGMASSTPDVGKKSLLGQ